MQTNLFEVNNEPRDIITNDGLARYYPSVFFDSKVLFKKIKKEITWQQDTITMYGKTHNVPRLQTFIGDPETNYSYSGIKLSTNAWTSTTIEIRHQLSKMFNSQFNCCLCNNYRNGKDYVAWHSDDEPELGLNPVIASVSLGQERVIEFRHKKDKSKEKIRLNLESGSVLLMSGSLQHHWQHQLIKTAKPVAARINLTYRYIRS